MTQIMQWWKKLQLKTKLILSFLFFGLTPACVITWISWNSTMTSLRNQAEQQLAVIRTSKTIELQNLFNTMRGQARTQASSPMVQDAMKAFARGYATYSQEFRAARPEDQAKSVLDYYQNHFGREYSNKNGAGPTLDLKGLVEKLNPNALALQYNYISKNPNPLGSKHQLMEAQDQTSWSQAHKKYHPSLKGFLEEFGYYDIFLVEPKEGNVVYTVYKELDFTSSLINGPYAQSNLGGAFRDCLQSNDPSYVCLVDLQRYFPSYEAPAAFIGAPIFEGTTKLGVLLFQIPVDKINAITTNQAKWKESGFGASGECYLVGKDKKMRSISRFLAENPKGYLAAVENLMSKNDIDYAQRMNTTAITQPVPSKGVEAAIRGETGFDLFPDYRNVNVFSSYAPLNLAGVNWYILAEIDEAEALNAVALARIMLGVLAISVVAIAVFSWFFSSSLATVLRVIAEKLGKSSETTQSSSLSVNEAAQRVSESTTEQAAAVQEVSSTLTEIAAMVQKSVDFAKTSTNNSRKSQEISVEGKTAVTQMKEAMKAIADGNREIMKEVKVSNDRIANIINVISQISEKTNVINDIVFQTKLLSFNASVEAARAGEHGKGFAVVAEEVGSLAQMSGNAAKEIKQMLNDSINTVQEIVRDSTEGVDKKIIDGAQKIELGVELTDRCQTLLDQIVDNISGVTSLMTDLSAAASEQAEGVKNIATAMEQIDETTGVNSQVAEQTLGFANNLASQAGVLTTIVRELESEIMGITTGNESQYEYQTEDTLTHSATPIENRSKQKTLAPKAHKAHKDSRKDQNLKIAN